MTRTGAVLAAFLAVSLAAGRADAGCKEGFAPDPEDSENCLYADPNGDRVSYRPDEQRGGLGVSHQTRAVVGPDGKERTVGWDSYYAADLDAALSKKDEGSTLVAVGPNGRLVPLGGDGRPLDPDAVVAYYQVNTAVRSREDGRVLEREACKEGFALTDGKCVSTDAAGTTTTYDPAQQQEGFGVTHQRRPVAGEGGTASELEWDSYYLQDPELARKIRDAKASSDHEATLLAVGPDGRPVPLGADGRPADSSARIAYYQVNVLPRPAPRSPPGPGAQPPAGPCREHPGFALDPASGLCRQVSGATVVAYDPDTSKLGPEGSRLTTQATRNPDGSTTTVNSYFLRDTAAALRLRQALRATGHEVAIHALDAAGRLVGTLDADGNLIGPDGGRLDPAAARIASYQVNEQWRTDSRAPGLPPAPKTQPGFCDSGSSYATPAARCVSEPDALLCGPGAFGGTGRGTGMGPFGGSACCDDSVCAKGFQCVFSRASSAGDAVRGQCQPRREGAPWNDPTGIGRPCAQDSACMSGYCNPRLGVCDIRPIARERNPLVKGVYGVACEADDQCYPGLACGPDRFCQWVSPPQRPGATPKPGGRCASDNDCSSGYCNSITLTCGAGNGACTRNEDCDQARGMRCVQFACQQDLKSRTGLGLTGGTLPADPWGRPQTYCGAGGIDDCFRAGIAGMQCNLNICRPYGPDFGLAPRQQSVVDAYKRIRGQGHTPGSILMMIGSGGANPCPGVEVRGNALVGNTGDPARDARLVAECGQGDPAAGELVAREAERVGKLLGIDGVKCGVVTAGGGPFAWNVVDCDIPGCAADLSERAGSNNAPALLGRYADGAGFKDPSSCHLTARRGP